MLYAMIDLSHHRIVEVLPVGEQEAKEAAKGASSLYLKELTELYAQLTGRLETFASLGKRYFGEEPKAEELKGPGPIATARRIIQELAGHPRREVIEACAKAGVKRSTAGTQYQRWRSEHRAQ